MASFPEELAARGTPPRVELLGSGGVVGSLGVRGDRLERSVAPATPRRRIGELEGEPRLPELSELVPDVPRGQQDGVRKRPDEVDVSREEPPPFIASQRAEAVVGLDVPVASVGRVVPAHAEVDGELPEHDVAQEAVRVGMNPVWIERHPRADGMASGWFERPSGADRAGRRWSPIGRDRPGA